MNNSYTIKDLIDLFLSKLWLIIVVTLCGGIAAFSISKFVLPLKYSSHISMYVQSYTTFSDNPEQNYNNISNSKQLINTYIQVLKDDAVMNAVGDELSNQFDEALLRENFNISNGRITPSSLRSCISITSVSDTSALNVNATTQSPEVSAAICNYLADVADSFIQDAVAVGSIRTIDTAKVYNTPVAPNIPKNTILGMAAGFMFIILLILVIDFFDNTVKSSEDLSKKYEKAILGEIQEIVIPNKGTKKNKNKKKKGQSSTSAERLTLLDKDMPFNITESCKAMRTNILFSLSVSENKAFVVSSANPGEGKSTTTANIAITLAQGKYKVLLADGDLRKPVQHHIFNVKNNTGFSSVLSKEKKLEECIKHTSVDNLDILPSGPIPPNPSELLGSSRTEKILNELSEKYDIIIIDTPPVNIVSDSLNLSRYVAGILTVVRYGFTTFEDIENAVNKIKLADMNLLGFVLNDIKGSRHGAYYSKYGKYKKYGYYKYKNYEYGYGQKPEKKQAGDKK